MAIEQTFRPDDGKTLPCRPGEARTEYLEPGSGLRLRVTAAGARAWTVVYYAPAAKTTRRMRLGDAAVMPLARARRLARAAMTAVEDGHDPYAGRLAARLQNIEERRGRVEERRRQAKDRARRAVTFGKLCADYVEWRRTTPGGRYRRPASPRTLAQWDGILRLHVLPVVGETPAEELTREDFVRVLERAVKRGGASMGPRTREVLSAVWRWAESRARILGVRLPAESPLVGLPRDIGAESAERERVLSPGELWHLWRATEGEGLAGLALRLMVLTGCRVKEATHLPSAEVDGTAKAWNLAAARNKSGRDRMIPLSRQAVEVLNRAGELGDSAHVFGPVTSLSVTVKRVRAAMGGEHWEPRDLRRTAATLCARLGADPFVVALVLGHAQADPRMPAVTRTYLRWDYQERVRGILDKLGEWIEETVTATEAPGAVAEFHR